MSLFVSVEAGYPRSHPSASDRAQTSTVPRSLGLLLPAAVLLPLLLLMGGAWLSYRQAWSSAEAELTRTADAGAEYVRRLPDGLVLRVDRANELLAGLSDDAIRAQEAELHAALRALVERTRDIGALHIFAQSRTGASLVSGEIFPVPPPAVSFEEREYARALRGPGAPPVHLGQVFVGQVLARPFFVVSRRREGGNNGLVPGEYDGLIAASADVNAVGAGLLRLVPGGAEGSPDVLALVRADGQILARSSGMAEPLPPLRLTNPVSQGIIDGKDGPDRAVILRPSGVDQVQRLAALRRVEGWPAFISVARPRSDILVRWRRTVGLQLAFGIPAMLALGGLAWLARRRALDLAAANSSLEHRVAERTAALEERGAALAESEERLRLAQQAGGVGSWEWDIATGALFWSESCHRLHGTDPTKPITFETWRAGIHPEDLSKVERALREALDGPSTNWAIEFRFQRIDDDALRWIAVRGEVVRDAVTRCALRVLGISLDVTERRAAEDRLWLLAREVDHRAKNALAVVQAALRLTPKDDLTTYAAAIEGRVRALARAHTLLAEGQWEGAVLRDLVEAELAAFLPKGGSDGAPRVVVSGPVLTLAPAAAQGLSMALHELATNAIKYGALSVPDGQVVASRGVLRPGCRPPRPAARRDAIRHPRHASTTRFTCIGCQARPPAGAALQARP